MTEELSKFIEELVITYNNELFKTTIKRIKNINDAEDVLNDLWLIVINKADKLYSHPNKIAWLNKTLSFCIKKYKFQQSFRITKLDEVGNKEVVTKKIETVTLDDLNINQFEYIEQYYDGEMFEEYKDILTQNEVRYLSYKFRDGLSNKEIADKLGKNYSAVTSFGNRIKKKIEKFLK